MVQSVLFFVLGFLCAGFLALMVAPAIWRRAVALTRKRIEGSIPLTQTEIQADKDRIRAEYAKSTRRLKLRLTQIPWRVRMDDDGPFTFALCQTVTRLWSEKPLDDPWSYFSRSSRVTSALKWLKSWNIPHELNYIRDVSWTPMGLPANRHGNLSRWFIGCSLR